MVNGIFTIPLSGRISDGSCVTVDGPYPLTEFVAGPENRLAATAVRPCFDSVPREWNPLLLYGPRGSGKSHLAHGLVAAWRERFGSQSARCLPGSQFAQDYAAAVATGKVDCWRQAFRAVGLFVLEDIEQLAEKRAAQQELIHLLDSLSDREARVVVTALALPGHSISLASGLRSRLSAGLAVPLVLPGAAARRAILERAAQNLSLPKRAVDGLADALKANASALVGALLELELKARSDAGAVDDKPLREFIAKKSRTSTPTLSDVASRSARYFGLRVADLKSSSRRRPLVAARGVAMYLARQLTHSSYDQIGEYFGGRDHTTVIHGCRRTERLSLRDPGTRQALTELKRWLNAANERDS